MTIPIIQIRNRGRAYAKKEATFGTAAVLAATDAIRHTAIQLNRKNNWQDSTERNGHPSLLRKLKRRSTYEWSLSGLLYPSGTIATEPDVDPILECGFGSLAKPAVALATTVAAAPAPAVGGATLTSVLNLAVGHALLIKCTGGANAGNYVRRVSSIVGSAVTWAPDLPQAPASGDAVKSGLAYKLASMDTALSLTLAHYLPNVSYQGAGCIVDRLRLLFDSNDEVRWEASGMYAARTRPAQTDPTTQTVVGTEVPSGLDGYAFLDDAAQEFIKATLEITNGFALDNKNYGLVAARQGYRPGLRKVTLGLNTQATDDDTLMDHAEAGSNHEIFIQSGSSEGAIVAIYQPAVDFEVPDDSDGDGETEFDFQGTCKGVSGNDETTLLIC